MAKQTYGDLLDNIPASVLANRSRGPNSLSKIHEPTARDLYARANSRIAGDSEAELVTSDGSSSSTTAAYYIQWSAGAAMVAGRYKRYAATDDQDLLSDVTGYQLDGSAAVALTADGKTYWVALVLIVVSGAVEMRAVFGDEADDASEAAVTDDQIEAALEAASISGLETHGALVWSRIKVQRQATDTIVMTHTDPASDDSSAAERAGATNPFGVTAA